MMNNFENDMYNPEDSAYSDTVRALVMAYHNKDQSLVNYVIESSLEPLIDSDQGFAKMLTAFVKCYHSLAFALAMILETDVPSVIRMDATADYMSQGMIMDSQQNPDAL